MDLLVRGVRLADGSRGNRRDGIAPHVEPDLHLDTTLTVGSRAGISAARSGRGPCLLARAQGDAHQRLRREPG